MSDLISRQAAIKAIEDLQDCYNGFSDTYDKACIIGALEELACIDAVPVIRCEDCKYYRWECDMCEEPYSTAHNVVHEDDYCSRAERKEE